MTMLHLFKVKRVVFAGIGAVGLLGGPQVGSAQEALVTPVEDSVIEEKENFDPMLRARLFGLGGALSNQGFRLRDGFWAGRLEKTQPQYLTVNLFAGNHYWFCATTTEVDNGLKLTLFDPEGDPVPVLEHEEEGMVAGGVTAGTTGGYIVQLETFRGPPTEFCLLYLFK